MFNWQTLLSSEAISSYIVFVAGVIFTVIGYFIREIILKKKPSIIRVEKLYDTSLVSMDEKVKGNIKIMYKGIEIPELYEASFMIKNTGEIPIQNIEIHIYLKDLNAEDVLQLTLTNEDEIQTLEVISTRDLDEETISVLKESGSIASFCSGFFDNNRIIVVIPFLNPWKEHEDYLGINIYALKPIIVETVTGKGFGWSTTYFNKSALIEKIANATVKSASPLSMFLIKLVINR